MFSLVLDKLLLFFIVLRFLTASSNDIRGESQGDLDKLSSSDRNSLWFGPRLGKRSLEVPTEDNRQIFLKLLEAADTLKYYYNQLPYYDDGADLRNLRMALPPATQKMLFTPKLGRSINQNPDKRYDNVDFTPRLGRNLPEDVPATPPEETQGYYPKRVNDKSKYFSPRLGRTMNFSPRLGRELTSIYDIYPESIRIARSTNQTRQT